VDERLDPNLLDEEDAFEIDAQTAHVFKHAHLGIADVDDVWASEPLFSPAKPPAHWLMCAEVGGRVLVVPLAPAPVPAIRADVALSAATRPLPASPLSIGGTDEQTDDTRTGA